MNRTVVSAHGAARTIAARVLAEARDRGESHEEIAARFDLPAARIKQLCADLLDESEVRGWGWRASGD
jgi:uncharacterized protein (DUF433 family)